MGGKRSSSSPAIWNVGVSATYLLHMHETSFPQSKCIWSSLALWYIRMSTRISVCMKSLFLKVNACRFPTSSYSEMLTEYQYSLGEQYHSIFSRLLKTTSSDQSNATVFYSQDTCFVLDFDHHHAKYAIYSTSLCSWLLRDSTIWKLFLIEMKFLKYLQNLYMVNSN